MIFNKRFWTVPQLDLSVVMWAGVYADTYSKQFDHIVSLVEAAKQSYPNAKCEVVKLKDPADHVMAVIFRVDHKADDFIECLYGFRWY